MISRRALLLGVVALAACAGCASGPGSVGVDPTSGSHGPGFASPPTQIQRCTGGVYSRAADLCVSEGP